MNGSNELGLGVLGLAWIALCLFVNGQYGPEAAAVTGGLVGVVLILALALAGSFKNQAHERENTRRDRANERDFLIRLAQEVEIPAAQPSRKERKAALSADYASFTGKAQPEQLPEDGWKIVPVQATHSQIVARLNAGATWKELGGKRLLSLPERPGVYLNVYIIPEAPGKAQARRERWEALEPKPLPKIPPELLDSDPKRTRRIQEQARKDAAALNERQAMKDYKAQQARNLEINTGGREKPLAWEKPLEVPLKRPDYIPDRGQVVDAEDAYYLD